MTRRCGTKAKPFCPVNTGLVGAGNVLPAMVSTYTTELPEDTFPSMVPAAATTAMATINEAVDTKRRVINIPFSPVELSVRLSLVGEIQTNYGRVGVERIECHRQSSLRIVGDNHGLRRAELI